MNTNTALIPQQRMDNSVIQLAQHLPEMRSMAEVYLKASIVNKQLDTIEKVMAVMFKAHELGISQTYALEKMSVIGGHVNMEAELMLALIYQSGCCAAIDIKEGKDVCAVSMQRTMPKIKHTASFSITDATRAGLTSKENWQKYPRNMLRWRAISECAKIVFPDILGGMNKSAITDVEHVEHFTDEQQSNSHIEDAAYSPVEDVVAAPETPLRAEPEHPLEPDALRNRITGYAARVRSDGDVAEWRATTAKKFTALEATDNYDISLALHFLLAKQFFSELTVSECKSLCKWLDTKNAAYEFFLITSTVGMAQPDAPSDADDIPH
jgi:hypothetical protein